MAALMDSGDATMAIRSHVVSSVTRTITLDDAGVVALMEIVGVTSKAGDRVNIEYLKQGRKPIIVKKSFLCVTDAEDTVQEHPLQLVMFKALLERIRDLVTSEESVIDWGASEIVLFLAEH